MTKLHRVVPVLGQFLLVLTIASAIAQAQGPALVPAPHPALRPLELLTNPEAQSPFFVPAPIVSPVPAGVVVGPWQSLPSPGVNAANPLLLNDGTVIVHQDSTPNWWKLTPDINGSYVNGTWSPIARMVSNYGPRFFGSQVLPDGRVEIIGGEYNFFVEVETSQGAIYNPNFGAWRGVTPPLGWTMVPTGGTGDSQSVVLNNGTYLQANCCDFPGGEPTAALLNATNLTWTFTGNFKFDSYNEEGWTLLPNGNVLTVDAYAPNLTRTCGSRPFPLTGQNNSEIYNSISGDWTSVTSSVGVQLADCTPALAGRPEPSFELGPAVLRPDGTVIAFGGTTQGTAHTAIFDLGTSTWTRGPDIPSVGGVPYTLADAPAALLPSGNVLFAASPSNWGTIASKLRFPCPTHFFELALGTNTITQVTDNPDGVANCVPNVSGLNSFQWNFLVLPTGQILAVETDTPNVWVYNPSGNPNPAWAPVINTHPSVVSRGFTYQLKGTQFNGLSQGVTYGDNVQGDSDRPIVKIVNSGTGHVFYERTSGYTISLAAGASSSTNFQVTGATETGASTLFVIANGISSAGVAVTVTP